MKKLIIFIATGFGTGLSPFASGTTGTLPGVILVILFFLTGISTLWQTGIAAFLSVLSIPICDVAEKHFGKKDDGRIVADEYMTFPLCVLGLPLAEHWWLLGMAFVVCRIMDIVKLPPARQFQEIKGGLGIALDDIVASLYALGINHLIWYFLKPSFV